MRHETKIIHCNFRRNGERERERERARDMPRKRDK